MLFVCVCRKTKKKHKKNVPRHLHSLSIYFPPKAFMLCLRLFMMRKCLPDETLLCFVCAHSSRTSCFPFFPLLRSQSAMITQKDAETLFSHFSLSSNDEAAKSSLASSRESENFNYFCWWCRKLCFQGAPEPGKTNNDSNVKEFRIVDIKMRFLASRRSTQHKKASTAPKYFPPTRRLGGRQMKRQARSRVTVRVKCLGKRLGFQHTTHLQTVWPALPIPLNGNFLTSRKLSCKTFLVSIQTRRTMKEFAWNACGVFDDDATFSYNRWFCSEVM